MRRFTLSAVDQMFSKSKCAKNLPEVRGERARRGLFPARRFLASTRDWFRAPVTRTHSCSVKRAGGYGGHGSLSAFSRLQVSANQADRLPGLRRNQFA